MGLGSRRDLLDDVFGAYNWSKVTHIAQSLLTKVKNAINECSVYVAAFEEFSLALPETSVAQWTQAVEAWEKDRSSLNPYEITRKALTQASVHLQLAQEDATRLQIGKTVPIHDHISPSVMITYRLEIEELQCHLREDSAELGAHSTDLQ
ncbi:uncharacterized protein LAESUDRAFT_765423 [Laetiporus sulphureus 93-53]|uniref:Uncharacterized protein n=1 Tax=Laetiporus sulphureus 93-53 TaxID=1314785 RepID=A0A165ARX1_9APHY|nr:uncharacterized protein LAESUDRAFT_765423 [Laetiporus sulphureus 93-53]KZS99540.1 hypothetical protein LAESUDRAFT_765423 [Laetiporus sulphureus 93-53]